MQKQQTQQDLLHDFLNVYWLRPEVALFLALSSHVLQEAPFLPVEKPSLDLGAGNGLFSFISMGGNLTLDYDVYLNAGNLEKFWENQDIYDNFSNRGDGKFIARKPIHTFSIGFDKKENLMKQASFLNLYEDYKIGDANKTWPLGDGRLKSIFSNIFYWLKGPEFLFRETSRVLGQGGRCFLALQDPSFPNYCPSYRSQDFSKYKQVLKLLNRGRSESYLWRVPLRELENLAESNGLKVIYHRYYLSETVLRIWDIGLRPLSPVLISMANSLSPEQRIRHKKEWIDTLSKLLFPIFEADKETQNRGGYLYLILEKI